MKFSDTTVLIQPSIEQAALLNRVVNILEQKTHCNSLTGLWNHRYFYELLQAELKRAELIDCNQVNFAQYPG